MGHWLYMRPPVIFAKIETSGIKTRPELGRSTLLLEHCSIPSAMPTAAEDPRKAHLLRLGSHFFALNLAEDKLNTEQNAAVNKFLDSQCPLLVLTRFDAKGVVDFRNDVNDNTQTIGRIVFYKVNTEPITADNYRHSVMVLSMPGAADASLYHALHQVLTDTQFFYYMSTAGIQSDADQVRQETNATETTNTHGRTRTGTLCGREKDNCSQ